MGDSEARPRSRFDQTTPRRSRFDRRSRSPVSRKPENIRARSPLGKGSQSPDLDSQRSPASADPAAAAGMYKLIYTFLYCPFLLTTILL